MENIDLQSSKSYFNSCKSKIAIMEAQYFYYFKLVLDSTHISGFKMATWIWQQKNDGENGSELIKNWENAWIWAKNGYS